MLSSSLGQLPHLRYLGIKNALPIVTIGPELLGNGVGDEVHAATTFPKLEFLIMINMPNWEQWTLVGSETGNSSSCSLRVTPRLEILHVRDCPKLRALPQGLQRLRALRILKATIAHSLSIIEDFPFITELEINTNKSMERISNLLALRKLTIWDTSALKCVDNLVALQYLELQDYSMKPLLEWLLRLAQQRLHLHDNNLELVMRCKAAEGQTGLSSSAFLVSTPTSKIDQHILNIPSKVGIIELINEAQEARTQMAALDALLGICVEKLAALIQDEATMILGVKEELGKLQRRMKRIDGALNKAARERAENAAWSNELQSILHEANDLFEDVRYERGKLLDNQPPSASPSGPSILCHLPMFSCFNSIRVRHNLANRIRAINSRINEVATDQWILSLQLLKSEGREASALYSRETCEIMDADVVGREIEDATDRLADMIVTNNRGNFHVIAVAGMGGIGKTTLAQKVYNNPRIGDRFQVKIWVCVTENIQMFDCYRRLFEKQKVVTEVPNEFQNYSLFSARPLEGGASFSCWTMYGDRSYGLIYSETRYETEQLVDVFW
uniref:Uncharacterized protein n=1 Tax=Ananas comosus var. bracteatus TaxID=296719 RepID=A0A6V7QKR4_ANACO|nr:unnamed protein product [Ananas comosus var. bracteatus]